MKENINKIANNRKISKSDDDIDKSLLNFPEKFSIKSFGLNNKEYCQSVRSIIENQVKKKHILCWQENPSRKSNYLAITITIMAQSQRQLDNIYIDLSASPHVKMSL